MKKTYHYFPHDYHARHDPKLQTLNIKMGCEGIGIYWNLVEMLYEQGGSLLLSDIEIYAKSMFTEQKKVNEVIDGYKLFEKNQTHFFSTPLLKRLKHIKNKIDKLTKNAESRWNAKAMQKQCKSRDIKLNEIKLNKMKLNEIKENKQTPESLISGKENDFVYLLDENFKKTLLIYLKGRKKEATPYAIQLILRKLQNVQLNVAVQMIEQAIEYGWQGIFPLKENYVRENQSKQIPERVGQNQPDGRGEKEARQRKLDSLGEEVD